MTRTCPHLAPLLLICLLTGSLNARAQLKIPKYTLDSTLRLMPAHSQMPFDYIYHSPQPEDQKTYSKYRHLLHSRPDSTNYRQYYDLACALWQLDKLADAERLFLNIIQSSEKHYTGTWYHSSDVFYDTTHNSYGYGSYTSSYKNGAAIHLAKIYIVQKKFDKALAYTDAAAKNYKVSYSCGTGFHAQQEQYDFLYGRCFEGMKQYDKVLDRLLGGCLYHDDHITVRVLQKMYTRPQIAAYLDAAVASIDCRFDTLASYAYISTYWPDNKTQKLDTLRYFSGSATMQLFGKKIDLPRPNLANGEHATRERFVREFKETDFYSRLTTGAGQQAD